MNAINRFCLFVCLVLIQTSFLYAGGFGSTWSRIYSANGSASSVRETFDQGFIVAGDISNGANGIDLWIVNLNGLGDVLWQKAFGGTQYDAANYIQQASNGDYVVAGQTHSFGLGGSDGWVIRFDSAGNIVWQKTYGGAFYDSFYFVQKTADGGFVLTGESQSFGQSGSWIVKLDSTGNIQWQKIIQGPSFYIAAIQQTGDGGFIASGSSLNGFQGEAWAAKLDASGNIQWQKAYGGFDSFEVFNSIGQTGDGGYIMAGQSRSFGNGSFDFWVVKLDSSGSIQWQKIYGGDDSETADSILITSDGGYIVMGTQLSFGSGGNDGWILKLDASGNVQWQKAYGGQGDDILREMSPVSDGGYIVSGRFSQSPLWLMKVDPSGILDASCAFTQNTSGTTTDTAATVTNPTYTTTDTLSTPGLSTAATFDTAAIMLQQCGNVAQSCRLADDFEDGAIDLAKWSILKPSFAESAGEFIGTPVGKKSIAVSTPFFSCTNNYKIQTTMRSGGGSLNRVWLLGWYLDKKNTLELLMKEEGDKWILKHKSNGSVIAKTKSFRQIDPNVTYHVALTFDGSAFHVFVDFIEVMQLQTAIQPSGGIGFQSKATTGYFSDVCVAEEVQCISGVQ